MDDNTDPLEEESIEQEDYLGMWPWAGFVCTVGDYSYPRTKLNHAIQKIKTTRTGAVLLNVVPLKLLLSRRAISYENSQALTGDGPLLFFNIAYFDQ